MGVDPFLFDTNRGRGRVGTTFSSALKRMGEGDDGRVHSGSSKKKEC